MENINTVKAAKLSRFDNGYTGAIEDAEDLGYEEREYALDRAKVLAAANRKRGKVDAAHYYEGRIKGFEDALTGM